MPWGTAASLLSFTSVSLRAERGRGPSAAPAGRTDHRSYVDEPDSVIPLTQYGIACGGSLGAVGAALT